MPKDKAEILEELVLLSRHIGQPERECVMLGEGNTSARVDENTFFVKASGLNLENIDVQGFVEMLFAPLLSLAKVDDPSDETVRQVYAEAIVNSRSADTPVVVKPSVETIMHALCLGVAGIRYVVHTHPTAVNMLTCSKDFPDNLKGRIYPDEIVVLGPESVFVSYIDPGLLLGKTVKLEIDRYIENYGAPPKVIYLQNHGMIVLGESRQESENITFAAVKAAQIRVGALSLGDLHRLSQEDKKRIAGRHDEKYRQEIMRKTRQPDV